MQAQPVHTSTISRINYGTIFEKYSDIYFSAEHWTHTFIFKLEKSKDINPFWPACNCTNVDGIFHPDFKYVFGKLSKLHNITLAEVDNTVDNILKLIPTHKIHISRRRRSILPIIGTVSRSLFGTATVEEVEKIANFVNRVKNKQNQIIEGFSHEINILHSFMGTTDHRISNLVKGIKENNMLLTKIDNDFKLNLENWQQKTSWIMSVLIDQLHKSSQISQIFSNLMLGVHGLMQNRLTTNLVPYATLAKTLTQVQSALTVERPGFQLLFTDPHFYYRHENVISYRHNNEILVTIKFPIGRLHKPMHLQRIQVYNVPVGTTSNHATTILDLPPFIAMSRNSKYYAEIQNIDLQKCHKYNKVIFCDYNIELIPTSHWTCSLALFKDNTQEVKNTCNFRFIPNGIQPSLRLLNQTHFLIYNISQINLQCSDGIKNINGCFFCILMLPCNCSLRTEHYYIPEKWTGCHNQNNNVSRIHPINLAILQEYFHAEKLKRVSSHSTFPVPLNISIPNFKLHASNISEIVANDGQAHLNLKKMIELSKKNKVIFSSLAEALIPTNEGNPNDVTASFILSIVASILASLATAFSIILFRKYQYICLTLAVRQMVPEAAAYSLPSFYYTLSTEAPITTSYPMLTLSQISDTSTIYLTVFIICFCIAMFVRKLLKPKFKTVLVLEITNGLRCIQVHVQSLPSNVASCHFVGTNVLTDITITSSITPLLRINWGDLLVTNSMLKNELQLQSFIRLNPYKGFLLKKMLKNKFAMFIWINHNNVCMPIKLCKPSCNECLPQSVIYSSTSQSTSETLLLK